jgi:putative transcriptional regulator
VLVLPTPEEDARITATALKDPDCPPMSDEELAALRPAKEVLPPKLYEKLVAMNRGEELVEFVAESDAEYEAEKRTRGRPRSADLSGKGIPQQEFARLIGIPLPTLRAWEQGTRKPSAAARALLKIAAVRPDAVREALAVG